jgi:outer membrane lipoprotein-sorting protein
MWFLLKDQVKLNGGNVTLTSFKRAPGAFQLGLVQTDEPDAGSVVMEFGDRPLELRQWTITDSKNQQVQVGLYDARFGVKLANDLFATPQKKSKRN